jgi:hypothetical protein
MITATCVALFILSTTLIFLGIRREASLRRSTERSRAALLRYEEWDKVGEKNVISFIVEGQREQGKERLQTLEKERGRINERLNRTALVASISFVGIFIAGYFGT